MNKVKDWFEDHCEGLIATGVTVLIMALIAGGVIWHNNYLNVHSIGQYCTPHNTQCAYDTEWNHNEVKCQATTDLGGFGQTIEAKLVDNSCKELK